MKSPADAISEAKRQFAQAEITHLIAMHSGPASLFVFRCLDHVFTTAFIGAQHLMNPGMYLISALNPSPGMNGPCVFLDRFGQRATGTAISIEERVMIEARAFGPDQIKPATVGRYNDQHGDH